jgi:tRNA (cmo5U34)-methyltransferase
MDDGSRWEPDGYLTFIREEIPAYDRLQDELVKATRRTSPRRILDLGSGSGETASRILKAHPYAELVGIDASEKMLASARRSLSELPATFHVGQIEDELPDGPFELIVSALTIHHLPGADKQDLFDRVAEVVRPGGRFVIADVVVPTEPSRNGIELSEHDHPSSVEDQLAWLSEAGFQPHLHWSHGELAVISADLR